MGSVTGIFRKIPPYKLWRFLEAYAMLFGNVKASREKCEALSRLYKSREGLEGLVLEGVRQNKGFLSHYLLNNEGRWNLLAFSILTNNVSIVEAFADSGDFDLDAPISPEMGFLELAVSNNLIDISEALASRGVKFIEYEGYESPLEMYMFCGRDVKTGEPVARPERFINQDVVDFIHRVESKKLRLV